MTTTHRPCAALAQQATRWLAAAIMALAGALPGQSDASPQSEDQPLAPEPQPERQPEPQPERQPEPQPDPLAPDETTMVERDTDEPPNAGDAGDAGEPPYAVEVFDPQPGCDPYVVHRPGRRRGLAFEIGTGYQQNERPVDPLTLALGLSAERMLRRQIVLGMRMTYLTSGDALRDQDGDGRDDQETGNTHQVSLTAGPRLRRWDRSRENPAAWEIGLGAGWVQALSDPGVSGPVAEIEIRHTWLSVAGLGLRVTQGFAGAEPYRIVLASASLGMGTLPARSWGAGCDFVEREPEPGFPLALGVHLPLMGYGASDLGVMTPGLGLSLAIPLRPPVDLLLHGDLLWFLRQERDRLAMHTGLAGLRLAMPRATALAFTALAGYGIAYRPTPGNIDSGPVMDLGLSWDFAREREGGLYLGAHGRFGLASGNRDLLAILLAVRMEFRSSSYPW
jgi:hypothetical protein